MKRRVRPERVHILREGSPGTGPVLCWMSRDQRARDNWALIHAQDTALREKRPLVTVFCLVPSFLGAALRQYEFMLQGLGETGRRLKEKNVPFVLLRGDPASEIPRFAHRVKAHSLVTDFDPLRIKRGWKKKIARELRIPVHEVDAHNVVPCRFASPKQEYAARTFRPKIHRLLPDYLEAFPNLKRHPHRWPGKVPQFAWKNILRAFAADARVPPVTHPIPGEKAALAAMRRFLRNKLDGYDRDRNDPARDGQSGLSPYLHFGHLSAQRLALEVAGSDARKASKEAFLEELIVRRELADNFCWHQERYDSVEGFPDWARKTLRKHRRDRRPRIYGLRALEEAETGDPLWNAAQREMVHTGGMHGYLRMYWGKKILEWAESPEKAVAAAVELNDRYQLDGRDPNGYTGIAWCIGGVHDRPWPERPVFGTVRTMTFEGCRRKFDVDAYIRKVDQKRRQ